MKKVKIFLFMYFLAGKLCVAKSVLALGNLSFPGKVHFYMNIKLNLKYHVNFIFILFLFMEKILQSQDESGDNVYSGVRNGNRDVHILDQGSLRGGEGKIHCNGDPSKTFTQIDLCTLVFRLAQTLLTAFYESTVRSCFIFFFLLQLSNPPQLQQNYRAGKIIIIMMMMVMKKQFNTGPKEK